MRHVVISLKLYPDSRKSAGAPFSSWIQAVLLAANQGAMPLYGDKYEFARNGSSCAINKETDMDGWWQDAMGVVRQEFSDLPNIIELTRVCVRLFMATLLGGIIGYERETAGSAAGFRTHMLVALGSALFVLVPLQAGMTVADMSRVLQGVVAGIGFLGAGAIIKHGEGLEIHGLTTAASIWLTCAVGIAAGMGREAMAIVSTVFALLILLLVRVMKTPEHPGAGGASP